MVSHNGGKSWQSESGLLSVQVFMKRPGDIDEKITKTLEIARNKIRALELPAAVKQELVETISDVDHKLHAVKYHLDNYSRAEEARIKELQVNYRPPTGVQISVDEPGLIYEIESFLFQTKSCLDILSSALKPGFGFPYCSFGGQGDDIIKLLQRNCPKPLNTHAQKIVILIEDAQDAWLIDLIKMRDNVTHYSRLHGFHCFIEDPYIGGQSVIIHYPTMPNGRRALEYLQEIWEKILGFCHNFLELAVEAIASRPK